tara:strand:- start:10293 stop:10766 length:474 start_codon:yes stop_codon:yes gene_type:complete
MCLFLPAQDPTDPPPKWYTTLQVDPSNTPVIDGKLNGVVWATVPWTSDFVDVSLDENTPPSVQTKFKIIYSEKYLYIALRALDPAPETISARLSKHDGLDGDRISVLIDSYHDLRTAFLFTVSTAGVRGDEVIADNRNFESSWNPIWSTKTVVDEKG